MYTKEYFDEQDIILALLKKMSEHDDVYLKIYNILNDYLEISQDACKTINKYKLDISFLNKEKLDNDTLYLWQYVQDRLDIFQ